MAIFIKHCPVEFDLEESIGFDDSFRYSSATPQLK
jgi:hypothetical protein